MISMKEWLKHHESCKDGFVWAVENCNTMQEVWDTTKPEWLIWIATREGCLTERELWEFALYCCEFRHEDKASMPPSIGVRRLWLDGKATDEEIEAAIAASYGAKWRTAMAAARDPSWCASGSSFRDSIASWLRDNCNPNFNTLE